LIVDCAFLGAIYSKIPNGGYVAIINAAVFCIPMLVWYLGEQKLKYWKKSHDTTSSMEKIQERFVAITNSASSESSKGKKRGNSSKKLENLESENEDQNDPKPNAPKDPQTLENGSSSSDPPPPTSQPVRKTKGGEAKAIHNPLITGNSAMFFHMQNKDKQITVLPQAGVFLCSSKTKTPLIFEDLIVRFSGIPATVIFLKPSKASVARVEPIDRIKVKVISDNIFFVSFSFGYAEYMEADTIERILKNGIPLGLPAIAVDGFTIFASAEVVKIVNPNWLWKGVLYLYSLMKRVFFGLYVIDLPPKETIYVTSVASL